MKDVFKLMEKINALLQEERKFHCEKGDSILCLGGNEDETCRIVHANPAMMQGIIVSEMLKDNTLASIILQAVTIYQKLNDKKKTVS